MCRTRGVRLAVVEGCGCKVGYDSFYNYPNQREFDKTKTCLWGCLSEAEIIQNLFKIYQNPIFIWKIWEDLQNFSRSDSLYRTDVNQDNP